MRCGLFVFCVSMLFHWLMLYVQILQSLVSKERAMNEVLDSGCITALLTCLNNIKKATKSTACIFDCLRSILRQDAAKLEFIRHDGVTGVARHLVDLLRLISKMTVDTQDDISINAANQCVCAFLEICNIGMDFARNCCLLASHSIPPPPHPPPFFASTQRSCKDPVRKPRLAPIFERIYCCSSSWENCKAARKHRSQTNLNCSNVLTSQKCNF
jgi:hypothetical protein